MKQIYLIISFLLSGIIASHAQSVPVRGVVRDANGKLIAGASIMVKDTKIGVNSTINGNFFLEVPDEKSVLVVSFLGYNTREVPVDTKESMVIILEPSVQNIDEVVVTGMTTTDKRIFTGAADRINAEDVILSGIADVSRSLEGRSAGVSVQNVSGTFGTAAKILVRGASSILGSSKPLWVVDGVIIEDVSDISADELTSGDAITLIGNAVAGLNADDIETFDILKDGSATSIYGARAMAGVIVITTKRGQMGSAKISYTADFTMRTIPSYSNFNIMNSQDQMSVYRELERKGWLNYADVMRARQSGIYGQMYRLITQYDATTGEFGLPNTTEARDAFLQQAEMRNTDWFRELFSNSIMQTHSVSISQGTEKASSYVSMSGMLDPGWYERSSVERYTLNANSQYKILPNLTFSMLGSGSYRKQEAPGTVSRTVDALYGQISRNFDINPYSYALNTSRTMDADDYSIRNYTYFNIKEELENNYMQFDVIDARFQGELKWKPLNCLELAVLGAAKYSSTSLQYFIKEESNYARAYREMSDATVRDNNPWLYTDPDVTNAQPISILPEGGFYDKTEYKMNNYDFRATATYNQIFNTVHSLSAFAGMELNMVTRTMDWFRGMGMQYESGEQAYFSYLAFKKFQEENSDYYWLYNTIGKNVAFFATSTYSYDNKYSITGTVRYEGSNRLGKSRSARWMPTWNIAGAWNIHKENFFKNLEPALSHLKLRISWSLTADRGPSYATNSLAIMYNYTPWRASVDDSETGIRISSLENSELTYEKKKELNAGLDIGLLDNRINIVTDFYTRNMYDQIGYVTTEGVGGTINKLANVASFKAHGAELTISSHNVRNKNFSWTTDLTFAYNKNEVTELKTQSNLMSFVSGQGFAREGYSLGALFSIPFEGLDSNGMPMFRMYGTLITAQNYSSINFQERNNLDWLVYEGTVDPPVTGGFGNVFKWKNFRLNVFITYAYGNKIRLDPVFNYAYTDLTAIPKEFKNRWMEAGDELITNIPAILSTHQVAQYGATYLEMAYNAYNYSTARVADGSFIRMKEVSLTYDFPLNRAAKIRNLSLKLMVSNPFLIYADDKLNGQDPEYYRSGGVSSPMPQQITMTLRAGF